MLVCLCVLLVSCTDKTTPKEQEQVKETVNPTEVQDTPEDEQPPEKQEQKVYPEFVNPLTGLETTKELAGNRPVAVMINNIHQSLPQIGVSYADVIYEVLEEGGITRLMALFQDYESVPEIGSIRSARDYYIDISDAHGAIYVHCGGSTYAKDTIKQRNTENIDGMFMGYFYRSAERLKTMAYEHTLMISGRGLKTNIEKKGYSTKISNQPLVFGKDDVEIEGNDASYIEIPFSLALKTNPYALSTFDYNADSKMYYKSHYSSKHIDGCTGEQLEFKNVLALECKQNIIAGDELGCIEVDFTGKGTGYYATDGKIKQIVWEKKTRTSTYMLYEADGSTPLVLNPGKSYIAIVPSGTQITAR